MNSYEISMDEEMKVLVICNDRKFTASLTPALKNKNTDVKVSIDSMEGLALFLNEDFDVIVLDMDILQFMEIDKMIDFIVINGKLRDKKMILMTDSLKTKKAVEESYRLEIHSCVLKPVEPSVFADIITGNAYFWKDDSSTNTKFSN
jgi:DNA-binding NtrC family response regulator